MTVKEYTNKDVVPENIFELKAIVSFCDELKGDITTSGQWRYPESNAWILCLSSAFRLLLANGICHAHKNQKDRRKSCFSTKDWQKSGEESGYIHQGHL